MDRVKSAVSEAVFDPSSLMSGRGGLHMSQIVLSLVTFVLAAFQGETQHTFWNYAMFTWAFCPVLTFAITLLETFGLHILLKICMDWDDFTTGVAMSSSLMTLSVFVCYANFYACAVCFYSWLIIFLALLCGVLYAMEVIKDKCLDSNLTLNTNKTKEVLVERFLNSFFPDAVRRLHRLIDCSGLTPEHHPN